MANKNNIRSIRFSDELAELIDRQIGDTFTAKFENLITHCVWELPQKEEQLKRIQEQIEEERAKLVRLRQSARDWQITMQHINARLMALETTLEQEASTKL